jgi:hypothetical protein
MTRYTATWPDGFTVIWRNLTWAEYKEFKPLLDNSIFQSPAALSIKVYRACLIDGPTPEIVPAGIADFIAKQQMVNNPFCGEFAVLTNYLRAARTVLASNYLMGAKALIAHTFNYKFEEIDAWDVDMFFLRLAQAELVSQRITSPVDPNAKEVKTPSKEQI